MKKDERSKVWDRIMDRVKNGPPVSLPADYFTELPAPVIMGVDLAKGEVPLPHEHVMHMVLDPSKWRFKSETNVENGANEARFQYEGVNLYTHFVWNGTTKHHDEVKQGHIVATIKYLRQHGITTTIGL